MIIAIDGPAAAGKSTVAKTLARELGIPFLDTGAMYRAVTLAVLEAGVDPHDEPACARIARAVHMTFDEDERVLVDGRAAEPAIRSDAVTQAVSIVSAHPGVRAAVVPLQRLEAQRRGGLVAEGRDIGSVVFPEAEFKFFLDASSEERARRRAAELSTPEPATPELYGKILASIRMRDRLDTTRKDSPLVKAPGAIVIETDELDPAGVAREMLVRIRGRSASR
jgi:cytidylate kinase